MLLYQHNVDKSSVLFGCAALGSVGQACTSVVTRCRCVMSVKSPRGCRNWWHSVLALRKTRTMNSCLMSCLSLWYFLSFCLTHSIVFTSRVLTLWAGGPLSDHHLPDGATKLWALYWWPVDNSTPFLRLLVVGSGGQGARAQELRPSGQSPWLCSTEGARRVCRTDKQTNYPCIVV